MKKIVVKGIMIAVLIMMSIGFVFGQGLYWESTTVIPIAKGKEVHSTSSYIPHKFKQSSEERATIIILDKEMIYQLNHTKKEYYQMTFAEMEAFVKKMSSEMDGKTAEMKNKLKDMPPEQRKMMEKMMSSSSMGGESNSKTIVEKTAETKSILDYPCIKYVLKEDDKEVGNIWATTKVPNFKRMQKDMKEFGRRMAKLMPRGAAQMTAVIDKVEGFMMQMTISRITTTVTKIEKKSVPASDFEIPSEYKKVNPRELSGNEQRKSQID
jgi:hypothetical protein